VDIIVFQANLKYVLTCWILILKFLILLFTILCILIPEQHYFFYNVPMKEFAFFAIDVGGTKIAGAAFNNSGKIVCRKHVKIEGKKGQQVSELILTVIKSLQEYLSEHSLMLKAVGVAVPGIVNADQTVWAPNISGWDRFPLYQVLRNYLPDQVALVMDNDRACYILGEAWQGAAVGCKHAIYLGIGTGIGAGILIDGIVLRGQSDIAGAIGWMALTDHHIPPYDMHGCFEHHASGNGIASLARQEYEHASDQVTSLTTARVFDLYAENDPVAINVLNRAVKFWGKAAANLVSLFNPERIIFGGGVFGPGANFLDDILVEARKWSQPISIQQVKLVKTKLEDDAGLYGAGFLVKDLGPENE
jgi:glucokinase